MIDTGINIAVILLAVGVSFVALGFVIGKYKRWRGDDVEVTNATEAVIAAQNKRMDVEDRFRSDGDDSS